MGHPKAALFLFMMATAATGCLGELSSTEDGVADADPGEIARQYFEAEVQPILLQNCTACHAATPPAFLSPSPDIYTTVTTWPNLIVPKKPSKSRLLVYGTSTNHSGANLTPDQGEIVRNWILLEPEREPGNEETETEPFEPIIGDNVVDLSVLGDGLEGASLTFRADQLAQGLYISQLTVNAGAGGVHYQHPLFLTWCPEPKPDPVDSFYGLDETVNPNMSAFISGGTLALVDFKPGCRLSVHFKLIEPGQTGPGGDGDGGILGGCTNVPGFTANAQPPLVARCQNCHAGGNAAATNAFDLRGIADLGTPAQTQVCGQTKGKINMADPQNSILFQRVAPGQMTGHPFTYPNQTEYQQLVDGVLAWYGTEM